MSEIPEKTPAYIRVAADGRMSVGLTPKRYREDSPPHGTLSSIFGIAAAEEIASLLEYLDCDVDVMKEEPVPELFDEKYELKGWTLSKKHKNRRSGVFGVWTTYTFSTFKEALAEQRRQYLDQDWMREKGYGTDYDCTFPIVRIERRTVRP